MTNKRRKVSVIAGVGLALLIAAAALPGRANATIFGNRLSFTHVNPGGLGGALIYPMFTAGNTNTLLAVTNTTITFGGIDNVVATTPCPGSAGCPGDDTFILNSTGRFVLVHFHTRKDTDSSDLRDWRVCLSPGDVWTATFTASGGNTTISTSDASTTSVPFPLTITGQTQGYIEAVIVDAGTTKASACNGIVPNVSGPNSDIGHRFMNSIYGEGFFVSLGNGLASGYNATALGTFQDVRGFENVVNSIKATIAPSAGVLTAQKRTFFALTHPGVTNTVGSLTSRWILNTSVGLDTQLVVTFPAGSMTLRPGVDFGFAGLDFPGCTNCQQFNFNIPATMALWLFDDEENVDGQSPRQVPIGKELNILNLSTLISSGAVHLPVPGVTGGWMRLMNDLDENQFVDAVQGKTCVGAVGTGDTCVALGGVLTNSFVPAMLPIVGFSILQGNTGSTQLSALLPWKFEIPASLYNCPTGGAGGAGAGGDNGDCTGVGMTP